MIKVFAEQPVQITGAKIMAYVPGAWNRLEK
jgi:hypothetical protein